MHWVLFNQLSQFTTSIRESHPWIDGMDGCLKFLKLPIGIKFLSLNKAKSSHFFCSSPVQELFVVLKDFFSYSKWIGEQGEREHFVLESRMKYHFGCMAVAGSFGQTESLSRASPIAQIDFYLFFCVCPEKKDASEGQRMSTGGI